MVVAAATITVAVARTLTAPMVCRKMGEMRWVVSCLAMVAFAAGCSSPLSPLGSGGGRDAAVDRALRPIGATVVDAAGEIGRGRQIIDAGPDVVGRGEPAPIGSPCQSGIDCRTGFCVDGVCCNTSCIGSCVTCAAPRAMGTCLPLDTGAVARPGGCPAASPATCGMTGLCDGVGGCGLYATGTLCVPSACVGGTTMQVASTCDGLGTCRPGPTQSCVPYTCASGACQVDDCRNPADCEARPNRDASLD